MKKLIYFSLFVFLSLICCFSQSFNEYITDGAGLTYVLVSSNLNQASLYQKPNDIHFYIKSLYSEIYTNEPIKMIRLPLQSELE